MYLLGFDVGSSSVKAALIDAATGKNIASDFYPKKEAEIRSAASGWAEQSPDAWWKYLCKATASVLAQSGIAPDGIKAIGISYQMHGLVCVDRNNLPLRDAIIWCDSRAVSYGQKAFKKMGAEWCMTHLLNSPGNFTAAKLAWVRDNEPEIYERIYRVMLPGDYIAMKLTGEITTTIPGLSEAMAWDFEEGHRADDLLSAMGTDPSIWPDMVPTFGIQGRITREAASQLGLAPGTPVTYRAGDQPNNALSLNVMEPGEIASTAGTSGVVYGITDRLASDSLSRVNVFAHVNHSNAVPRLGVMTCINGTGILNAWMHRNVTPDIDYISMNLEASRAPIGADGVIALPWGNGAERVLGNRPSVVTFHGIDLLRHDRCHLLRAAQEGIVFAFMSGIEIMRNMGVEISTIHAGNANMFLSPLFRSALSAVSGARILLHDTDGAAGAARGAGIGAGIYRDRDEAFSSLEVISTTYPDNHDEYLEAYEKWKQFNKQLYPEL